MEIRQKLTYQFMAIVAVLLFVSLLLIYLLFSNLRETDFNERLSNKAKSIAQLIAETDNVEPSLLKRIETNNPTSLPDELVVVYDKNNKEVFRSFESSPIEYTPEQIEEVRANEELYFANGTLDVYGFYYQGEEDEVVVFCSAEDIFGLGKLRDLRLILFSVFLLSLVAVYFAGGMFATKALRPISDVVEQVREINISNINMKVEAGSGKDEIARLAETFNKMLQRLADAFKMQKNFIANSSHELRTPLTAITGQLEVALMKERTAEEYKESITSALSEIKNLNNLTNRLLLLTKVNSYVSAETFEKLRVDDILWKLRSEIKRNDKGFTVNIQFDDSITSEGHFYINGNEELLKSAFRNLIKNGCKYSQNNKTDVLLSAKGVWMQIQFKDTGIGIPETELDNIFQPFYRASNVKKSRGHGIGLSLVEKIILLHNGHISVKSKLKKGTEFTVKLPYS